MDLLVKENGVWAPASPVDFQTEAEFQDLVQQTFERTLTSQCLVDHRAPNVAPFIDVTGADHNDIEGNFETAQLAAQTGRLGTTFRDLVGLNYEQVEVAVRAGLTTGARAEEDNPRPRGHLGQSSPCLLDQILVRHGVKVNQSLDALSELG